MDYYDTGKAIGVSRSTCKQEWKKGRPRYTNEAANGAGGLATEAT